MRKSFLSRVFIGLAILMGFWFINCSKDNDSSNQSANQLKKAPVPGKIHTRETIETQIPPLKVMTPEIVRGLEKTEATNALGIWLWYIEGTGYSSHSALAQDLAAMGVKRVYIKVADGSMSSSAWPEVTDVSVPQAYKAYGIEPWAWSYNYPGNDDAQSDALYYAAKTGYVGYALDIEVEFDGQITALHNIMQAFTQARTDARAAGYASSSFKIYCTSWGNPQDHNMHVEVIDQYVDAHMPQTYVEHWGSSYMNNITATINAGNTEYRSMGCTKPIHHIVSDELDVLTATQINEFIQASGIETSVWRVPGGDVSMNVWNTLEAVNWNYGSTTPSYQIALSCPSTIPVNQNTIIEGTASSGITRVKGTLDGYAIGEATVSNGSWAFTAKFNTTGSSRNLVVTGYTSTGAVAASASKTIAVVASTGESVTVTIPASIIVGSAATFTGTVSSGITKIIASVDGYQIANKTVSNGQYSFSYTFNSAGANRTLVVNGFNAAGASLAQVQKLITIQSTAAAAVTVTVPSSIKVGIAATFSGTVTGAITKIIASVDGYTIATKTVSNGQYSFAYTFNSAGTNRSLVVNGFNSAGVSLAQVQKSITVEGTTPTTGVPQLPYFYQYYNSINPGGSCQNTSMAMILKYYGASSETPDEISSYYGTSQGQTVAGWQSVFNSEAAYFGLSVRDAGTTVGSVTQLRSVLAQGKPVAVHGYLTAYGHVIVILGYDGTYYTCHDPAGKWNQVYMGGGYTGTDPTGGKFVKYSKAALEQAIAPDGNIWMHILSN